MSKTPIIPSWIKDFRTEGFTNIWELLPNEKHLYGTETMFGDWDAEVLILLQDFSTAGEIRRRIAVGDPNPYRHDPSIMTNRRLLQYAGPLATGDTPTTCGLLYGSALVGLLKEGEGLSAKYSKSPKVTEYTQRVLAWVTGKMPNLKVIACCGKEAWETATSTFGIGGLDWRGHLGGHVTVSAAGKEIALFCMRHPVNRDADSISGALEEWAGLARFLAGAATSAFRPTRQATRESQPTASRTRHDSASEIPMPEGRNSGKGYLDFWIEFSEYSKARGVQTPAPHDRPFMDFKIRGRGKDRYSLARPKQSHLGEGSRVTLLIDSLKEFNRLLEDKEAIERELGSTLRWEKSDGLTCHKIVCIRQFGGRKGTQEELDWFFQTLSQMRESLGGRLGIG